MNKLLKYVLIVSLSLIVLALLIFLSHALYENYLKSYERPEGATGVIAVPIAVPKGPLFFIYQILLYAFLGVFPLFVIFMSIMYFVKSGKYLNSLLIPLSYSILGAIITFIWLMTIFTGESGMIVIYIYPGLIGTLIAVGVINGIIKLVKK